MQCRDYSHVEYTRISQIHFSDFIPARVTRKSSNPFLQEHCILDEPALYQTVRRQSASSGVNTCSWTSRKDIQDQPAPAGHKKKNHLWNGPRMGSRYHSVYVADRNADASRSVNGALAISNRKNSPASVQTVVAVV